MYVLHCHLRPTEAQVLQVGAKPTEVRVMAPGVGTEVGLTPELPVLWTQLETTHTVHISTQSFRPLLVL